MVVNDISRRMMIGGAAATGGMVMASGVDGDSYAGQPPFGPLPPVLAGKELPSLRYPLGRCSEHPE